MSSLHDHKMEYSWNMATAADFPRERKEPKLPTFQFGFSYSLKAAENRVSQVPREIDVDIQGILQLRWDICNKPCYEGLRGIGYWGKGLWFVTLVIYIGREVSWWDWNVAAATCSSIQKPAHLICGKCEAPNEAIQKLKITSYNGISPQVADRKWHHSIL